MAGLPAIRITTVGDEEMDMPMSVGIGAGWRFSDRLTVSLDVYRTEWGDMSITDSTGNETSPITGKPSGKSDIDPTHQVRVGAEYLLIDQAADYTIPFRAGLFYDPAPSEGSPDDFYGMSLGTGFSIGRIILDMSYQYRFGTDVGGPWSRDMNFPRMLMSTWFMLR